MARTTVKLNHSGVESVLKSSKVRAELTRRAERVLEAAKAAAPVATGAYRDGLHIVQATTDRAVTRVAGSSDHDFVVEADTGNLARALDQAK
jgi:hypothetical protein